MKKAIVFITLFLTPAIAYADIWDNSTSSLYNVFYLIAVLPVLFWIANWVLLVFTLNHRKIRSSVFWTVTYINLILALFSFLPVWEDFNHNQDDSQNQAINQFCSKPNPKPGISHLCDRQCRAFAKFLEE